MIVKGLNSDGSDSAVRLLNAGGIQFAAPKADVSVDEFNDTVFNSPLWVFSGTAASESGGLGKLEISWGSGGSASSSAETNLAWSAVGAALEIRVAYAEHLQVGTRFGGEASVRIGGTQIYSGGQNRTESAVDLQVVRGASLAFYRKRVNNGAWTDWGQAALGTLRLEVSGSDVGTNSSSGTAKLHVDYVRYRSSAALLAAGGTANDLGSADIAYRAATNTLYFKTASSQSWLNSQLSAFASGGKLVALDSSDVSAWVQGKFGGEYWIGYYRDFSTNPWRWLSRGNGAFTSWLAGQPAGGADQLFAFSNAGVWSSATGTETKFGVFEVKAPITAVTATTETEPPATNRLQPAGRNLTLGRFNSSSASQQSLVEAFIEDTAPLGVVNAGDKFVLAELVLGASPLVQRTLSQRTLTAATLANNYGLAAVRSRAGTSDFLVTAENDGQIFAWLPATPGAALQRKTLSTEHVGKAWHSLERVPMAGGADGLIGLRVTSGTPQTADVVLWAPTELGFSAPPVFQQSPPTARLVGGAQSGGLVARLDARIWDSEGNLANLRLEFRDPVSGVWSSAVITSINGQPPPASFALVSSTSGTSYTIQWNAGAQLGSGFVGTILLRVIGADSSGEGVASAPQAYEVLANADSDGDGISDDWEIEHSLNPEDPSDALTDHNGNGIKNLLEFALGMTGPQPNLIGLPIASIEDGHLTLTVTRNPNAKSLIRFNVEVSDDLQTWRTGPTYLTVLEDTPSRLKVQDKDLVASAARKVMRLKVDVPVPVAPSFSVQPVGGTVLQGTAMTVSVDASGWPLPSYQWEIGPVGGPFSPISGATANSYATGPVDQDTLYRVRVTNGLGSVLSSEILVHAAPEVTSLSPESKSIGAEGGTYSVSVSSEFEGPWTINGLPAWISIAPSPSQGWDLIIVTVQRNTSVARTATFTIGGKQHAVIQAAELRRFLALRTTAIRTAGTAIQLSEFEFYLGGVKVPMTGVVVTNPGFSNGNPNEVPASVIDGNLNTKWLDYSYVSGERLIFQFPTGLNIDSYRFATGGDAQGRDPVSWTLEGSPDGLSWTVLDTRQNAAVPTTRNAWTEMFSILP